ncbi:putative Late nodulin [Medicago truncatula]|uniref:Nodule Cysteine-Rich (NCR) secreted peptide n=1 Tax=Medicago truncatula TaxID=3880 RepID=G7KEA3_MEDTR|nr:Nodule Cysteine-Rich (NCR) secreted peptide [Medicago truncatula]RHN56589.1 putative Late nodulin [Medicago truncatula]
MIETLKFVYAMILFLSLFLITSEVGGLYIGCETDRDYPPLANKTFYLKCIDKKCEWTVTDSLSTRSGRMQKLSI